MSLRRSIKYNQRHSRSKDFDNDQLQCIEQSSLMKGFKQQGRRSPPPPGTLFLFAIFNCKSYDHIMYLPRLENPISLCLLLLKPQTQIWVFWSGKLPINHFLWGAAGNIHSNKKSSAFFKVRLVCPKFGYPFQSSDIYQSS